MIPSRIDVNQSPKERKVPLAAQMTHDAHPDQAGLRPVRAVADFLAISRSKVYQLSVGTQNQPVIGK